MPRIENRESRAAAARHSSDYDAVIGAEVTENLVKETISSGKSGANWVKSARKLPKWTGNLPKTAEKSVKSAAKSVQETEN